MCFSINIFAAAFLLVSSTALAAYEHDLDAIVVRHENDLVLEARGEMTEFEARALLISRAPPNGDCSTPHPSRLGAVDCYRSHGHGWKFNGQCWGKQQMMLKGNNVEGICYF